MTTLHARLLPTGQPRSLVFPIGLTGAVLGVLAGLAQATVGSSIPVWSGAKAAPVALGLLTIVLSVLAGLAALRLSRPDLSTGSRAGLAVVVLVPGLLCFTTVGRLWYLPGALLVIAGLVSIERWRATAALVRASWMRCLLGLLGASELLMAAGAPPLLLIVGAVGGLCLVAAAWVCPPRTTFLVLVVIGTVPFAALAWTAVVPVLLLLVTAVVAVPLSRGAEHRSFTEAVPGRGDLRPFSPQNDPT